MTGQHRGQHRDTVHPVVKALFVLGHLTVIGLLGITVHNQETSHSTFVATAPDSDPPDTT
ncbi:hypothetical protein [Streptomyces rubellomurinus]|uniref:Uncharacterized protein n=1 Tax=Streptomyces rubellomurinus (strain ATCC 31215) TaxID=359131 RepID=A0A0F2TBS1_STRR3|nr:hypothetical protein [Streptomyces rubellomurinus]KJS60648.1 hypothetical protein VM95_19680 [Streptomyces rubellomurinus]